MTKPSIHNWKGKQYKNGGMLISTHLKDEFKYIVNVYRNKTFCIVKNYDYLCTQDGEVIKEGAWNKINEVKELLTLKINLQ